MDTTYMQPLKSENFNTWLVRVTGREWTEDEINFSLGGILAKSIWAEYMKDFFTRDEPEDLVEPEKVEVVVNPNNGVTIEAMLPFWMLDTTIANAILDRAYSLRSDSHTGENAAKKIDGIISLVKDWENQQLEVSIEIANHYEKD